ncbi:MAG: D-isomer specific 2-hydroxyacid dehydrogenase family protein [Alphaproteobacteria bacterium]|nr:D-isomer specific 2-hydroxyacid dehydrogenase family protein [Alphaproteobacteria bacterium]
MSTTIKPPAFVDCYGDLAERLTPDMTRSCPGLEVFRDEPGDEDALISRLAGRHHAIVYMGYLSGKVLRACPDLKTVAYLSTGLETHADLDAAGELGIRIEGVKGYGDRAVAEHAVTLALCALKRVAEGDRKTRNGDWQLIRSEEINGKVFGLMGLGGIGRETARLAGALGARVIAWNRSGEPGDSGARMVSFDELLAGSDILSLHLALNPHTRSILGREAISRIKPGAVLVNTARAGLVDEEAMMVSLQTGHLRHCALDVFHDEPLGSDSPLTRCENVTLTPHSAWLTTDSIDRLLMAGINLLVQQMDRAE